jgi:hypothetical protein
LAFLRTLALVVVLFLLSLATGCGGEPSALVGSWTPERGAVAFTPGEMPYTYEPSASAIGGGVIVEAAKDGYSVTLVSGNGNRRTAAAAAMKDGVLLVDVGAGQLSLTEESPSRVLMLWTTDGIPAPGSGVYLEPGTPPSQ